MAPHTQPSLIPSLTPNEFITMAMSTKSPHFDPNSVPPDILHSVMGIANESGELMGPIKAALFYGQGTKSIDWHALDLEYGDILWFIALYCRARGVTMEELMAKVLLKLEARYPDKFSPHKAVMRDLQKEYMASVNPAKINGQKPTE